MSEHLRLQLSIVRTARLAREGDHYAAIREALYRARLSHIMRRPRYEI